MARRLPPSVLLTSVLLAATVNGQGADPKAEFFSALGQFSLALDGVHGDEGALLIAALESMAGTVTRWDGVIESYERRMASEIGTAGPPLAARMHVALASEYLDRGRVVDALTELAAARKLDPASADAPLLQGLASSHLLNDHKAATEALRSAATTGQADPARTYLLARHLARVGELDASLEALRRFESLSKDASQEGALQSRSPFIRLGIVQETPGIEPFLPPVLYAEGFASVQRGDFALAISQFRDALARDPLIAGRPTTDTDPRTPAAAAFRDGRVREAQMHLESALAESPGRAETHRILGMVLLADGQHERAVAALRTAVGLRPDDERARLALASALESSGQLEAATQALVETLEPFPRSGRTHYALARTYEGQGKYTEAVRELEATVALAPLLGLNSVYQSMGKLHRARQNFETAVDAFAARVELTPNVALAHEELGDVYLLLGRHEQALAEFRVALMLDPSRASANRAIGQVHLREGRYEEAAESSLRALRLDARDREARYVYATSLIRLGRTDEGTHEMQLFQRLQAEDAAARSKALELGALRREGSLATAGGEHAKAVELLQRALVYDPTSASSHVDLGRALLAAGRAAEAVERLETAAALRAPIEVHVHLANAYAALGRADDAVRERTEYERLKQQSIRTRGNP